MREGGTRGGEHRAQNGRLRRRRSSVLMLKPMGMSRVDALLFSALLAAGILAEFALKPPMYRDAHALGTHTIALLIPYVAAIAFSVWTVIGQRSSRLRLVGAATLFVLLTLPFLDLLASPLVHFKGDDSYRYSLYARNMLREHTLWGSDQLFHGADRSRVYLDQPGYRYYLAAAISVLGGEHRGLQLANMGILLGVMLLLLSVVSARTEPLGANGMGLFVLASAPYAAKNILYGYGEWLAVGLFAVAAWAYLTHRLAAAMLLLALAPFIRQNLVLVSLVMAAVIVVTTRRWTLVPLYVSVIALPVYHNLYYAGELQFFVERTGVVAPLTGNLGKDIAIKLAGYVGYVPGAKLLTLLIAIFFAPLGTAMIASTLTQAQGGQRALLGLVSAATIGPTLLYGSGSYPRFEFVNLSVILLSFLMLQPRRLRDLKLG